MLNVTFDAWALLNFDFSLCGVGEQKSGIKAELLHTGKGFQSYFMER